MREKEEERYWVCFLEDMSDYDEMMVEEPEAVEPQPRLKSTIQRVRSG